VTRFVSPGAIEAFAFGRRTESDRENDDIRKRCELLHLCRDHVGFIHNAESKAIADKSRQIIGNNIDGLARVQIDRCGLGVLSFHLHLLYDLLAIDADGLAIAARRGGEHQVLSGLCLPYSAPACTPVQSNGSAHVPRIFRPRKLYIPCYL